MTLDDGQEAASPQTCTHLNVWPLPTGASLTPDSSFLCEIQCALKCPLSRPIPTLPSLLPRIGNEDNHVSFDILCVLVLFAKLDFFAAKRNLHYEYTNTEIMTKLCGSLGPLQAQLFVQIIGAAGGRGAAEGGIV